MPLEKEDEVDQGGKFSLATRPFQATHRELVTRDL